MYRERTEKWREYSPSGREEGVEETVIGTRRPDGKERVEKKFDEIAITNKIASPTFPTYLQPNSDFSEGDMLLRDNNREGRIKDKERQISNPMNKF